jgi:inorganic pyrophosphatase
MESFYSFRPHPWHGIEIGSKAPKIVNAYIEITPFDSVKYEIDKQTGYLKVDRPQLTSSLPPILYGFIPQTFSGKKVASFSKKANSGDKDPLDICVFSERPINKSEILMSARVIGGFRMIDRNEADDKIIAVLDSDPFYTHVQEVSELPQILIERLIHYFLTYKLKPNIKKSKNLVSIEEFYNKEKAYKIIKSAQEDYQDLLKTFKEKTK